LQSSKPAEEPLPGTTATRAGPAGWKLYLSAAFVVAVCGVVGWICRTLGLTETNIVMIFLAGVAFVAARFGHGPAIATAVLGVLVFDFFFVPPVLRFTPSDTQYFVTLSGMLGIGLLISELMARLQTQLFASQEQEQRTAQLLRVSQQQERRTAQLYQMTRQLSMVAGTEFLVQMSGRQLAEAFSAEAVLFLREPDGPLQLRFGDAAAIGNPSVMMSTAQWVAENNQVAGLGADKLPDAPALFVPMSGPQQMWGVLGVRPRDAGRFLDVEERRMLETCAQLIALSIERDQSLLEAQQAQVQVQSEQLRNSLLSAVSHDLRTPLATIAVTASSLLEGSTDPASPARREMLQTVVDESHRLARQVDNLLDMARLDSGAITLNRDWQVLEELVGVALARLRPELASRTVHVRIPSEFPLLWVAGDLIEQMLVNLLENAIRYTAAGSQIEISAAQYGNQAEIRVVDNGPGLPPGSEAQIFDKFFRGRAIVADGQRGIGLGLAICRAIVQVHGGQIRAANRSGGGAEFIITLPCSQHDSQVTLDDVALDSDC
jgi:two-component system, OmpR family, sensor histidine kinase KdpD